MGYQLKESRIFINKARFHAFHGVLPQEKLTGNDYLVSICLKYDITQAMQSDDVIDTLNYASVYETIKQEMNVRSKLIENVAYRISKQLMDKFKDIKSLHLSITKENPPIEGECVGAGVEIEIEG